MRLVGSPSPNVRSLWTSRDTAFDTSIATERAEDQGMQLESKSVVFVNSDDWNGLQGEVASICGVVGDLYRPSTGIDLLRRIIRG